MSGGVDSAVALLRAGPKAIGVTLRLWLDPEGPDSERACCSPEAVIAARETCHGLGLPHVTLDLREEFRRAVVEPFVQGYARGETPNPCGRCNGSFRFDELLAFAARAGARKLWTGHYARIVERDGRRLLARAADPDKDQSYMLAQLDPEKLEQVEFPLGELTKAETRAEAAAAGLDVAERRESQEACFLAGDDYRSFLERRGLDRSDGAIVDEAGPRARPARWRLALHARPAAWDRRRRGRASVRPAHRSRAPTRSSSAHAARSRARTSMWPACCTFRSTAPTPSSATARQRSPHVSCRGQMDSRSSSSSRPTASPLASSPFSTTKTAPLSAAAWCRPRRVTRITSCNSLPPALATSRATPSPPFSWRSAPHSRTCSCAWAEPSRAFPRSSRERKLNCCPSSTKSARASTR